MIFLLACFASFMAGAALMGICVMWAAFIGITGKLIPDFGFGVDHPGEE